MSGANKRVRDELMQRMYPVRCWYCRCTLDENTATLDHVTPQSKGGHTSVWNCVLACASCNREKGSRKPNTLNQRHQAMWGK